ncbi:unnamed protein product, partial [Vitis vinifera]
MERKKASLEALYIHSMAKSIPNLFGTKTRSVLCLKVPSRTTNMVLKCSWTPRRNCLLWSSNSLHCSKLFRSTQCIDDSCGELCG